MNTYRATILNTISDKKRRINTKAYNILDATNNINCKIHHTSEDIIEIKLWYDKK